MFGAFARSASKAGLFGRPGFLLGLADRRRDEKKWAEAAALYREYLDLRPGNAAIWVQLGHALKESGRSAEAEIAYGRALTLDPYTADTHLQLGHLLKDGSRRSEARAAYGRALELDPTLVDARLELARLADVTTGSRTSSPDERARPENTSARLATPRAVDVPAIGSNCTAPIGTLADNVGHASERNTARRPTSLLGIQSGDRPTIAFDVSDLVSHLQRTRLPTGIQRVQIEIALSFMQETRSDTNDVRFCVYSEPRDWWVRIPDALFLQACELSLASERKTEPEWSKIIDEITEIAHEAKPMEFCSNAALVNLGTSWWMPNYFLSVRNAKAECGLLYIPFVHDLIPLIAPEHCIPGLAEEFVGWLVGAFDHADHFLVNSEATRRDLEAAALQLGRKLPAESVTVIPLNAGFQRAGGGASHPNALRKWGLMPEGYVLFVSTIESRKNHLGAFNAWLELLRKYGPAKTPKLVCVGNDGWLNAPAYSKLNEDDGLKSSVVILTRISDEELAQLYDHCLFTFYPSLYEGWGLPVTESLCHGKVPLLSMAPALREAGGRFANYFETVSQAAMISALERLIFDEEHRLARERLIADQFRPRSWSDVAEQIEVVARDIQRAARERGGPDRDVLTAQLGVFYPPKRNDQPRIWPNMRSGEVFRAGEGWWCPEHWGTWTKPDGGQLILRIPGPHRRLRGYFGLKGLLNAETLWRLEVATNLENLTSDGHLAPNETKWTGCEICESGTDTVIRVTLKGDRFQELASPHEGVHSRRTSVGFLGFYFCESEDFAARTEFVEAIVLNALDQLEQGARKNVSVVQGMK